jgi:hypothetical protein
MHIIKFYAKKQEQATIPNEGTRCLQLEAATKAYCTAVADASSTVHRVITSINALAGEKLQLALCGRAAHVAS